MTEEDRRADTRGEGAGASDGPPLRDQPGLRMRMGAVPKRIARQHRQLETLFELVQSSLGNTGDTQSALAQFRDALNAHIDLEDQVFFPALRGLRPDVATELTTLVRDHHGFRTDLDSLRDLLDSGSADRFRETFAHFRSRFRDHEQREQGLVADFER